MVARPNISKVFPSLRLSSWLEFSPIGQSKDGSLVRRVFLWVLLPFGARTVAVARCTRSASSSLLGLRPWSARPFGFPSYRFGYDIHDSSFETILLVAMKG